MSYLTTNYISKYGLNSTNENSRLGYKNNRNVAVYVGSFDPPHLGHQNVVTSLLNLPNIDDVFIVPTYQHCFKDNVSNFDDRVDLIHSAFGNMSHVYVSPVERELIDIMGVKMNRTHITLRRLKELYNDITFHLVMGTDLFNNFSSWENLDYYQDTSLIVIHREKYELEPDNLSYIMECVTRKITFIGKDFPFHNISSTYIKKCFAKKEFNKLNGIVNSTVIKYIKKNEKMLENYQQQYINSIKMIDENTVKDDLKDDLKPEDTTQDDSYNISRSPSSYYLTDYLKIPDIFKLPRK